MLAAQRWDRIIEIIAKSGYAEASGLSARLGASEATIRRDLAALDRAGRVVRTHGGAALVGGPLAMHPFSERELKNAAEKRRIAERAAACLEDGDTILIDGGTTTFQMVPFLAGRRLQVITNSVPVAQALGNCPGIELLMTGGWVYPRSGNLLGPHAVSMLRSVHARRAFIGVGGISPDGISNTNALVVETERALIEAADEVNVLADHTKFGRRDLAWLCGLEKISRVFTDRSAPKVMLRALRRRRIIVEEV